MRNFRKTLAGAIAAAGYAISGRKYASSRSATTLWPHRGDAGGYRSAAGGDTGLGSGWITAGSPRHAATPCLRRRHGSVSEIGFDVLRDQLVTIRNRRSGVAQARRGPHRRSRLHCWSARGVGAIVLALCLAQESPRLEIIQLVSMTQPRPTTKPTPNGWRTTHRLWRPPAEGAQRHRSTPREHPATLAG